MTYTERQAKAVRAAIVVAERLDMPPVDPVILKDSSHTIIHLTPSPVVARVCTVGVVHMAAKLAREVAVAHHLAQAHPPVMPPSTDLPPGPHFDADIGLTLWQFIDHQPACENDGPAAAEALCRVHETLADYTGNLPSFTMAMDTCRTLLTDASALCALAPTDRAFLLAEYDRLRGQLASLPYVSAPLHGDPHLGNVLMTSRGPRWTDWEAACVGPREWDLSCLPETTLAVCRTIDQELLIVLRDLRSVCVAVWCWTEPDREPEKREAAEFHLYRLREHSCAAGPT